MDMPSFYRIRQDFDTTSLKDVAAAVRDEFSKSECIYIRGVAVGPDADSS